jgi:hypothetical protein
MCRPQQGIVANLVRKYEPERIGATSISNTPRSFASPNAAVQQGPSPAATTVNQAAPLFVAPEAASPSGQREYTPSTRGASVARPPATSSSVRNNNAAPGPSLDTRRLPLPNLSTSPLPRPAPRPSNWPLATPVRYHLGDVAPEDYYRTHQLVEAPPGTVHTSSVDHGSNHDAPTRPLSPLLEDGRWGPRAQLYVTNPDENSSASDLTAHPRTAYNQLLQLPPPPPYGNRTCPTVRSGAPNIAGIGHNPYSHPEDYTDEEKSIFDARERTRHKPRDFRADREIAQRPIPLPGSPSTYAFESRNGPVSLTTEIYCPETNTIRLASRDMSHLEDWYWEDTGERVYPERLPRLQRLKRKVLGGGYKGKKLTKRRPDNG